MLGLEIIFALVKSDCGLEVPESPINLPLGMDGIVDQIKSEFNLQGEYFLIPIISDGGTFSITDKKKSSTYRERIAVMELVTRNPSSLGGNVIIYSDNRNVMLEWHGVEDMNNYFLSLFAKFQRFMGSVHHLHRNHPLSQCVDSWARLLEDSEVVQVDSVEDQEFVELNAVRRDIDKERESKVHFTRNQRKKEEAVDTQELRGTSRKCS